MSCNWDDPEDRLRFIEAVGIEAYNKAFAEPRVRSRITTVNGYDIRRVSTRFGRLFMVEGGDRRAFATRMQAEDYARTLKKRGDVS
jgi:hypothetical protein